MDEQFEESVDLEFRPSESAVTQAMRMRVARAWAHAEIDRDYRENQELWEGESDGNRRESAGN